MLSHLSVFFQSTCFKGNLLSIYISAKSPSENHKAEDAPIREHAQKQDHSTAGIELLYSRGPSENQHRSHQGCQKHGRRRKTYYRIKRIGYGLVQNQRLVEYFLSRFIYGLVRIKSLNQLTRT